MAEAGDLVAALRQLERRQAVIMRMAAGLARDGRRVIERDRLYDRLGARDQRLLGDWLGRIKAEADAAAKEIGTLLQDLTAEDHGSR